MMRIMTRIEATGVVTLVVAGTFNAVGVADFDRALEDARRLHQPVVLDLSEVRLIDRPTLKYLIDLMQHDFNLVICPDFVEHWIHRESARERIE
jgi:anti-anti-sigma regulatory factor